MALNNNGNFSNNRNNSYKNNCSNAIQSIPYKPLSESTYVDTADEVVKTLKTDSQGNIQLTTSQIRNLLAMTSEILNKINSSKSADGENSAISADIVKYLNSFKIRSVYEHKRTKSVGDFIDKAHILDHLKSIKTMRDCELFCHYMEALVAFHRFQGGKD